MSDTVAATGPPKLFVRTATVKDILAAIEGGLRDFRAAPLYALFFGLIFAGGGMLIVILARSYGLTWIAFPMAAGFALLGPFAAVGLYEVSRRLSTGEPLSFGAVLGCMFAQSKRELGWMSLVTVFVFVIWMYQIRLLYALFFGVSAGWTGDLFSTLTSTQGVMFFALGTTLGAILSLVTFSLTVISFPLLLETEVDFVTAMITSIKAVLKSPVLMLGWGALTAVILLLSLASFFIGLIVTLPLLGFATWHLYKRLVEQLPLETDTA